MRKESEKLFKEAKKYLVGGVNSPIRAFGSVGGKPLFIKTAKGSRIKDADSKEYIDYVLSYGALILGHCRGEVVSAARIALERGSAFGAPTEAETSLAKEINRAIKSIDKVRFVSSGSEAVAAAVKLAKAYTGRKKILKFKGCYHGWIAVFDIEITYNNRESLKRVFQNKRHDIAAIIVEPVAGNNGVVIPSLEFLKELRTLSAQYGVVLIFDEVITGFRFCYGGAQDYWGVRPDLTCLGKIIGGGFPLAAVGGKKEIMDLLAPLGKVYQAGTLSGNPLAAAAGLKTLEILRKTDPYKDLAAKADYLCRKSGLVYTQIGPMFGWRFLSEKVYKQIFKRALEKGIYLPPSRKEAVFLSLAHSNRDIEKTIKVLKGG